MQSFREAVVGARHLSLSFVVIAAVFAGGLGLGLGLRPADAQSGGQIRGCVNSFTGALRIINGSGQCSAGERPLNWNQHGLLDIEVVRARTTVNTEEAPSSGNEFAHALCPAGYRVVGGGASGVGNFQGTDRWFVDSSGPRLADEYGSQGVDGWFSSYKITSADYPVEGEYSFESVAICALTSN